MDSVEGVRDGEGAEGNVETALWVPTQMLVGREEGRCAAKGARPKERGRDITYAEALVHRLGMMSCVGVKSSRLLVPQHLSGRSH